MSVKSVILGVRRKRHRLSFLHQLVLAAYPSVADLRSVYVQFLISFPSLPSSPHFEVPIMAQLDSADDDSDIVFLSDDNETQYESAPDHENYCHMWGSDSDLDRVYATVAVDNTGRAIPSGAPSGAPSRGRRGRRRGVRPLPASNAGQGPSRRPQSREHASGMFLFHYAAAHSFITHYPQQTKPSPLLTVAARISSSNIAHAVPARFNTPRLRLLVCWSYYVVIMPVLQSTW